jgi:branched-chain amino acid aminotransferase
MNDCIGKYYAEGMSIKETAFMPEDVFEMGVCLYEVLRVMDGFCIFPEDHINRMKESVRLSGSVFLPDDQSVIRILGELIRKNNLVHGNIRLVYRLKENASPDLYMCCIPHSYPEPLQYERGVLTALYNSVRVNPNVKKYYPENVERLQNFIHERNVYEALLLDEKGNITEGSRSNVFFIRDNTLFTAPGTNVLSGITRDKVFAICKN